MISTRLPRNKYNLVLIALILLLIIVVSIVIVYLNISQNNTVQRNTNLTIKTNEIINTIEETISPTAKERPEYSRVSTYLNQLRAANTPDEKYIALKNATSGIQLIYSLTNEPELYKLINTDINNFAKENFPDLYSPVDFEYPCQDPACAKNPNQPSEILSIVNDINSSDFPDEYKEIYSNNVLNANYLPDDKSKVLTYMIAIRNLEASSDLSSAGLNIEIANNLRQYVTSEFPEEFKEFTKLESIAPTTPDITETPEAGN